MKFVICVIQYFPNQETALKGPDNPNLFDEIVLFFFKYKTIRIPI